MSINNGTRGTRGTQGIRTVDRATWKRRKHFELFSRAGFPFLGLTARMNITRPLACCREQGRGFFPVFLCLVTEALNAQENFRYRIDADGNVVLCDSIDPTWTVLEPETELFYFAGAPRNADIAAFARSVASASENAVRNQFLANERLDVFYTSVLPWTDFTDAIQPLGLDGRDSVPRILWGAYVHEGDQTSIAFSCTAHHGFVDGLHLGKLIRQLEGSLEAFADMKTL